MRGQLSAVRWQRVGITVAAGGVLVLAATTTYNAWRKRDGWCVRFYPDGSEKVLYGAACQIPK